MSTAPAPQRTGRAQRCPACGHRFGKNAPFVCPLCQFDLGDTRVTGADATPYAQTYAEGRRGWGAMCEWVWLAPNQRMQHLALVRASAASLRFARTNLAVLTLALGLFMAGQVGWHWVAKSPTLGPQDPAGEGWIHAAAYPRPLPENLAPEAHVDLWWGFPLAAAAGASSLVTGIVASWLALLLIRIGATRAHLPQYRAEQRMTAALHYNTAWTAPMFIGTCVLALLPLSHIGAMERWPFYPPAVGLYWAGAVVIGFGVCMWWYWLIRLGATAPPATRARVVAFFALGAPLIVAAITAAWYLSLTWLWSWEPLLAKMNLSF